MAVKIDISSELKAVMGRAMTAFSVDDRYVVAMVKSADTLQRKKDIWAVRKYLRICESEARGKCEKVSAFRCANESPCGIGNCKFAKLELTQYTIKTSRKTVRPQLGIRYTLEEAVQQLASKRFEFMD